MRRLLLASGANRDPAEIVEYIGRASGSVRAARGFGRQLLDRCSRLAALPGALGVQRPEFGQDVRVAFQREYLIAFRYEPGRLRVLRIIEGHRDLSELDETPGGGD